MKTKFIYRFRDKFNADLKEKNHFNREVYASFTPDFDRILRAVENATTKDKQSGQKMKTFEESAKSQKTIASLIENPNSANIANSNNNSSSNKKQSVQEVAFKENIEPVRLKIM
jgi:signal recognition particle receptor subunit alpha